MTIVTCQLSGGLGNQLNQIAGTLVTGWNNNLKAVFDRNDYIKLTQGNLEKRYKNTIFRNLNWIDDTDKNTKDTITTRLTNYFHDVSMFYPHRDRLVKKFQPLPCLVYELSEKYAHVFGYPNCAIHVRRGDLAQFPGLYKILTPDYYQQAINRFDRGTKFLIFSDDMEYCRRIFTGDRFFFSEEIEDDIDLYLMSLCQNQIIANSTFSWWGAFLNTNPDKIVLQPQL